EVMDLACDLGGTITGEHGVGRLKAPWLAAYLGEDVMELNHRIKTALDPDNIFNPGSVYLGLASGSAVNRPGPGSAAALSGRQGRASASFPTVCGNITEA